MKKSVASMPMRAVVSALTAALCALVFIVAMGMLEESPLPAWLPVLAALGGGGLGAWFCFAGRELRRERSFRHWGARLCAIACAALLITLATELFWSNHRAFTTRNCEPEELPLDYCTAEDGAYLSEDGSAIELVPDGTGFYNVYISDVIDEETVAIRCRLSGVKAPVWLTVHVRDDGNAYTFEEATQGVILPGSGLDSFEGALYSNGALYALRLEFELPRDKLGALIQGAFLESVELNPRIAVAWQPVRMGLRFVAWLLLLCMVRFPWRKVAYRRGCPWHRAVIALPMVLLMLLNVALCVLATPPTEDGDLFRGIWNEQELAECGPRDAYGQLFAAFQAGQLNLLSDPPEMLANLVNPYDTSERWANHLDFYFDYAMFDGKYYVYFGPAPVLLTYYPCYWLTGRVPTEQLCGLLLSLLATPLIYLAVLGMARKYARRPNLFLLSLSCLTAACVAGWPALAVSASRYENALACCIAMMAGALGLGYHALMQKRGGKRATLFVLCGVCFALQGMSRANTLLITTAMLAPGFIGVLAERGTPVRLKVRDAACFLLPALTGVGLVMWYNLARFGSVAEFGQLYQLTTEDIRYNTLRLEYIPQAIWHYLLDFPAFAAPFPYVEQQFSAINVTGNYFWRFNNVGVLSYPVIWLAAALPYCLRGFREDGPALRRERGFVCYGVVAVALALMVVDYFYAGVLERYTHDYLFALALLSALVGVSLAAGAENREDPLHRAFGAAYPCMCVLSIGLSLLLCFSNEPMYIKYQSPEFFYGLVRMFYPY